jgi:hypothetical protein
MNASALHFENEALLDKSDFEFTCHAPCHLVITARIWGMVLLVASPAGRDVDYAGVWATYKF